MKPKTMYVERSEEGACIDAGRVDIRWPAPRNGIYRSAVCFEPEIAALATYIWRLRGPTGPAPVTLALSNRQDESMTSSTARATEVARSHAGSVDGDAGGSRGRDEDGCDGDLQLLATENLRAERGSVDDDDR